MSATEALPGFDDRTLKDRYCDLVLTGGVTSAIAYPPVVFGLGEVYRFNAIGGSSSGAGIAAVAAAAEYRRRHGSPEGFQVLLRRTRALADERCGRANLSRLFQPVPAHRRLFRAVLRAVATPTGRRCIFLRDLACAYWLPLALGAALGQALVAWLSATWCPQGWVAHLLAMGLGALAGLALFAWLDLKRLANDDYGLCDGMGRSAGECHPPLTVWLHELIQEAAGRAPDGAPLTFADLHAAPSSPRETLGDLGDDGSKSIRLEVVASNITLGEPVRFPRDDPKDAPLYFRRAEMLRLFPKSVVDHLMVHSTPYAGLAPVVEPARPFGTAIPPSDSDDMQLRLLPALELPLIVAARMSVSFPLLFTAVPLWCEDTETNTLRRCLMLDGGFCSNFPIHLFDSFVPAWPTFGVSLYDLPETDAATSIGKAWLPASHLQGMAPRWNGFDERSGVTRRIGGLATAMLETTKDWSDTTLARMPGVRDRVVRVGLAPGIGGLNLLMSGASILGLAGLGKEAVRLLLARYSKPGGPTGQATGWDEHRWARFNLLCQALQSGLGGLSQAAQMSRHATPLRDLIRSATERAPLRQTSEDQDPPTGPLRPDQAAALEGALAALAQAERALAALQVKQPYTPYPEQQLRLRPPM